MLRTLSQQRKMQIIFKFSLRSMNFIFFSEISKEIIRKKKKEQKTKSGKNLIRKNVPFVTSIIAAADSDASAGWVMLWVRAPLVHWPVTTVPSIHK